MTHRTHKKSKEAPPTTSEKEEERQSRRQLPNGGGEISIAPANGTPGGRALPILITCFVEEEEACLSFLTALYRYLLRSGLAREHITWDAILPDESEGKDARVPVGDHLLYATIRKSAYSLVYTWVYKEAKKRGFSRRQVTIEQDKNPPQVTTTDIASTLPAPSSPSPSEQEHEEGGHAGGE